MAGGLTYDCELPAAGSAEQQTLSDVFREYRAKLLRMILLRLDSRVMVKVDSEDVLQDVFAEAVRRFPQYLRQPTAPVFIWLRQLTSQALIDLHRRFLGARMRNVRQEVDLHWGEFADTSTDALAAQLADSLTTPSQCAVRGEALLAVKAALDTIDPIDREVLVLRHLEELSNHEVAQVLGIDKSAASKRYLRALARLKGMMPAEE